MGDFTALHQMIAEAQEAKEERRKRQEEIEKALMNGPNVERMKRWEMMMARDAFNESDHPRDEKGRFTEKGITTDTGTISEGQSYGRIGKTNYRRGGYTKRKELRLPPGEYNMVVHELNTNLTKEEIQRKGVVNKAIRNHVYTVKIDDYGYYRVLGKQKLR